MKDEVEAGIVSIALGVTSLGALYTSVVMLIEMNDLSRVPSINEGVTRDYRNSLEENLKIYSGTTSNEIRTIDVTSLDAYWQGITADVVRTRCLNPQKLYNVLDQEKIYLVNEDK